jgi:heat shock protein HslJ
MKKTIYIVLLMVTIVITLYTGYYASTTRSEAQPIVVATSTEDTATITETIDPKHTLITKSGKMVSVFETNPNGQSLSMITILPSGFASTTPLTLETNKLTNFFLADLNNDTFDELVITTQAQGSGTYGDAIIYTTIEDKGLLPVSIPTLQEKDTTKGGLFEGYTGHDTFSMQDGALVREFPTYAATDTINFPTGPTKKVYYILSEKNGMYTILFSKTKTLEQVVSATTTPTLQKATSTAIQLAPKATTTPTITVSPQPATTAPQVPSPLLGTSWIWVSASAEGVTADAPAGEKFVVTFDAKSTSVSSKTDCNTITGDYTTSSGTLRFGTFATTMMFCDGSQESIYSELLSKTRSYLLSNNKLILTLSDKGTMTFKKK